MKNSRIVKLSNEVSVGKIGIEVNTDIVVVVIVQLTIALVALLPFFGWKYAGNPAVTLLIPPQLQSGQYYNGIVESTRVCGLRTELLHSYVCKEAICLYC